MSSKDGKPIATDVILPHLGGLLADGLLTLQECTWFARASHVALFDQNLMPSGKRQGTHCQQDRLGSF
jgi:hypothetical protein